MNKTAVRIVLAVLLALTPVAGNWSIATATHGDHPIVMGVLPSEGAIPGQHFCVQGEGFLPIPDGFTVRDLMLVLSLPSGGAYWYDYYTVHTWEETQICAFLPASWSTAAPMKVGVLVSVGNANSAPPFTYQVLQAIYLPLVLR